MHQRVAAGFSVVLILHSDHVHVRRTTFNLHELVAVFYPAMFPFRDAKKKQKKPWAGTLENTLIQLAEVHTLHYDYGPSRESASEAANSLQQSLTTCSDFHTQKKRKKNCHTSQCFWSRSHEMQFSLLLSEVPGLLESLLTCLDSFKTWAMFVLIQPNAFVKTESKRKN